MEKSRGHSSPKKSTVLGRSRISARFNPISLTLRITRTRSDPARKRGLKAGLITILHPFPSFEPSRFPGRPPNRFVVAVFGGGEAAGPEHPQNFRILDR